MVSLDLSFYKVVLNYYVWFIYKAIHSTAGFYVICVILGIAHAYSYSWPPNHAWDNITSEITYSAPYSFCLHRCITTSWWSHYSIQLEKWLNSPASRLKSLWSYVINAHLSRKDPVIQETGLPWACPFCTSASSYEMHIEGHSEAKYYSIGELWCHPTIWR